MLANISDIKNVLNRPVGLQKDGFTKIGNQEVKHFPDGLIGVLIETPLYDGGSHRRTEYSVLHTDGDLLMYVNIHPENVIKIDSKEDPVLFQLSSNHPGGGGHFKDRDTGYKLLEQYGI